VSRTFKQKNEMILSIEATAAGEKIVKIKMFRTGTLKCHIGVVSLTNLGFNLFVSKKKTLKREL
jgi:hypothetical protein